MEFSRIPANWFFSAFDLRPDDSNRDGKQSPVLFVLSHFSTASYSYYFAGDHQSLLRIFMKADHPVNGKPVGTHAKIIAPEGISHRHGWLTAC